MTDHNATAEPAGAHAAPSPSDRPRIYVACLAAYNNGFLHGRWIEATTPGDIMAQVRAMLAESPEPGAEEWAIHDYEGFEDCALSEYASFESVCALADFIEEHGALGAKLYRHLGDDLGEARAAFEDYAGEFRSAADFAEQLHEDAGTAIPESLRYYIDWEALARDMTLNGEIMVFETGFDEIHVFWSR
ncbi:MAG TPA: antirestriction protein ArdA [Parvularculaceae bacterium]|nr:antirestriction protein ArdA [Parvularculaceae bacterium]